MIGQIEMIIKGPRYFWQPWMDPNYDRSLRPEVAYPSSEDKLKPKKTDAKVANSHSTARKLRIAARVAIEKPRGNWPQPAILLGENRLAMTTYKRELARQIGHYEGQTQIPENVAIGIAALRLAKVAGLEVGEVHKDLGV